MIIQHNLAAMFGDRQYKITNDIKKKSSEKLGSGYRINRAADDVAGLAISEKMRRQIRGLTQASLNVQDGISMVQSAEGALNEVHEMLQRMTKYRADLGAIQNRMEHMVKNLDNVVENTTAAESRFRDTDMADEITRNANTELLAQAGQMVLAQANQSKQGVLNLLQ